MPSDPYAVLRALVRAEAIRNAKPELKDAKQPQQPPKERGR
ncbi:hypothetical protein [Streptomyces chromofuscus]|nr:hypothetical protein [Streptomyces chromofuscus]GGS88636.1 hypothetical protein GCM10010254_05690 [Streptomyces chromofuscus]